MQCSFSFLEFYLISLLMIGIGIGIGYLYSRMIYKDQMKAAKERCEYVTKITKDAIEQAKEKEFMAGWDAAYEKLRDEMYAVHKWCEIHQFSYEDMKEIKKNITEERKKEDLLK